jgi:hypothetical protein
MHHRSGRRFMGKIPNAKSVTCRRRPEAQLARLAPCAGISARRFAELDPMRFESGHGRRSGERTLLLEPIVRATSEGPMSACRRVLEAQVLASARTCLQRRLTWRRGAPLCSAVPACIYVPSAVSGLGRVFRRERRLLEEASTFGTNPPMDSHGALSSTHRSCVREA